jgi:hypothetical protein
MFIRKKTLKEYIEKLQAENRAFKLEYKQDCTSNPTENYNSSNNYWRGYEDGIDNFFNAICYKFKIKSIYHK